MSDDTAGALSMGLVSLTSKSKLFEWNQKEIKSSTNTKAINFFDNINTSPFELSTYKIIKMQRNNY